LEMENSMQQLKFSANTKIIGTVDARDRIENLEQGKFLAIGNKVNKRDRGADVSPHKLKVMCHIQRRQARKNSLSANLCTLIDEIAEIAKKVRMV